ncbi:MAG: four-carbon acid sugar kinase family protein, partial [Cetobacterium sp.]
MEKKIAFDYADEVKEKIEKMLKEELIKLDRKIVVLDDDPTGSQTVKNLTVYCDWEKETIKKAFNDKEKMFFILTNSRSFSEKKTLNVHKDIMNRILDVNEEQKFLIYSRGDSTLRGHYPLETEILKEIFEKRTSKKIDGEIICPFFLEGKRVTIDGVHYIVEKERIIPVAETEFSKDKSFSYVNSDLAKWCEEKSSKKYREENIVKISLEEL